MQRCVALGWPLSLALACSYLKFTKQCTVLALVPSCIQNTSLSLSRKNMYPSYHVIIILQHTSFGTTPPTSISVQTNHFLDGNNKKVRFWGLQTLKYLQYDFFSSAAHAVSNVLPEQMSFRPMTVPGAWNNETWNTQAILECRKGMLFRIFRWPIMTRSV